jgi:Phage integrase family/Domain of unknown function (DUF222)
VSGQVSTTLERLAHAIDRLDLPVDSAMLTEAFALADRLNAKLLVAVGEHDAAELWRNDGATSMTAWLRHDTRRSGRDAAHGTKTARRLRQLPVTAAAHRNGTLSSGQVQAIVANLTDRTAGLFADHETALVPELERCDGPDFLGVDGQRIDRHAAGRIVRRIARRAGIAKRVEPHTLRHAFITAALDAGVPLRDVQVAASHADPRTTMRYDRARVSLDRHATYIVATFLAGASRRHRICPLWPARSRQIGPVCVKGRVRGRGEAARRRRA